MTTLAHHSYAQFDREKTVTLEGTIKEFQWTNPHVWIQLTVTDPESGENVEWSIETDSPNMLSRRGWSRTSLQPGDSAVAAVHPQKNAPGSHIGGLGSLLVNGEPIKSDRAAAPAPDASPSAAIASGPGSLQGIWQAGNNWAPVERSNGNEPLSSMRRSERDRVLRTADGEWPPMRPWAEALLEERIRLSQAGTPEALTLTKCLPGVPVMLLGGPYPIQILETPGQVSMLLEEQNHYRLIYLDATHPENPDPTFMGHSVGRWEGDTLVVDTIALKTQTPIDRVGMPHSEDLHLVERYRRIDDSTIDVTITIDDPQAFTMPWDVKRTYRSVPAGVTLTEYICENNRDYAGDR